MSRCQTKTQVVIGVCRFGAKLDFRSPKKASARRSSVAKQDPDRREPKRLERARTSNAFPLQNRWL